MALEEAVLESMRQRDCRKLPNHGWILLRRGNVVFTTSDEEAARIWLQLEGNENPEISQTVLVPDLRQYKVRRVSRKTIKTRWRFKDTPEQRSLDEVYLRDLAETMSRVYRSQVEEIALKRRFED